MPCAYVAEWQERASRAGAGTLQPRAVLVAKQRPCAACCGAGHCKRACFAAQNRLFCSVKQWVLQLQDVRFVSF